VLHLPPTTRSETGLIHAEKDAPAWKKTLVFTLDILLLPFLLILHAIRIYLLPCVSIYINRLCCAICCALCPFPGCIYRDSDFKACQQSIGAIEAGVGEIMWKRGNELRMENEKHAHPFLFEGGIEPADIAQGQLGDCWLLSAFACMAEHPGFIQNMFLQREYNPRGKYQVRLFDKLKEHFVVVNIDDRIPCSAQTGKPCFTSPHGDELWVLLLEKAFAKVGNESHPTHGDAHQRAPHNTKQHHAQFNVRRFAPDTPTRTT